MKREMRRKPGLALLVTLIITALLTSGIFVVASFASGSPAELISGFWQKLTAPQIVGTNIDPKDLASSIKKLSTPSTDNNKLSFPELPAGFSIKVVNSSDANIIDIEGNIKFPDIYTIVKITAEVKRERDGRTAQTVPFNVLVPAITNNTQSNIDVPYQSFRYGTFFHWVSGDNKTKSGAGLVKPDGTTSRGISAYATELELDKIVDDIAALGFDIVYVTDYHGLGTTLHPSAALNYWRGENLYASERDVISEFILKLKAKGIALALFTHPLDGHDFSIKQQALLGWTDPTDNFKKWNDYTNDVYGDIVSRYGKDIVALGFDSAWNDQPQEKIDEIGKLDHARLRATIKKYAPNLQLISLCNPNDTTDLSMKEVWRPYWFNDIGEYDFSAPAAGSDTPAFNVNDYFTDLWPASSRPASIIITNHWTVIQKNDKNYMNISGAAMFRYTVLQHAASYSGPGVLWANSPYVTGEWQLNVFEQLLITKKLMDPISESLKGTYPSTSFITQEGKSIVNITNGFVATRKPDNTYEYIHVLIAPEGKTLTLGTPADNKSFALTGKLLPSGKSVTLTKTGTDYTLTLPVDETWGALDTVIKLTVNNVPAENVALYKPVYFSSSNEALRSNTNAFWHAGLTDGANNKAWSSNIAMGADAPQWITVDLLKSYSIGKVSLFSYADGFPQDYKIETSLDNKNFTAVATLTNQSRPAISILHTFTSRNARYVRISGTKGDTADGMFRLSEVEISK